MADANNTLSFSDKWGNLNKGILQSLPRVPESVRQPVIVEEAM
jgi:hypothetical protein